MPNAFEEVTAKGAGTMGAMVAGLKGLRGVFTRLADEHKQVSTLFVRTLASSDPEKRADLWGKIRKELLSHERAEMQEVYAAIDREQPLMDVVEKHNREAQQLESLILQLDTISFDSPEWEPALKQLQQTVQTHVREEENDFFPRAQEALGKNRTEALEQQYLATRRIHLENL